MYTKHSYFDHLCPTTIESVHLFVQSRNASEKEEWRIGEGSWVPIIGIIHKCKLLHGQRIVIQNSFLEYLTLNSHFTLSSSSYLKFRRLGFVAICTCATFRIWQASSVQESSVVGAKHVIKDLCKVSETWEALWNKQPRRDIWEFCIIP